VSESGNVYVTSYSRDSWRVYRIDGLAIEADFDGVADVLDNCIESPNADQWDADHDGIGNACDCDVSGDLLCGFDDFNAFLTCFGQSSRFGRGGSLDPYCAESDFDVNGIVGFGDFGLFLNGFGGAPGPSCCAT
ncbi:MAG: hypothetical protein ACRD1Z_18555, partial [Vicinamibacteria bacterium]